MEIRKKGQGLCPDRQKVLNHTVKTEYLDGKDSVIIFSYVLNQCATLSRFVFLSHGWSRIITGFFFMSRIIEFSNFSFSHGESRIFFIPNYRIIEFFFFTRSSTDYHGFSSLSRIIELFFSHGLSRTITDVLLYPELSNYRIHDKIYKSVTFRDIPCEEK